MEAYSEKDTFEYASRLARNAEPGSVICLEGDLGTGKTVFAKGFAAGLGVQENISSPTFTIIKIYESGRLPLYHFDMYRIEDEDEMNELGFEEYFYGDGVCLIEWPSQIPDLIPAGAVTIRIRKDPEKGDNYREITCN